MTLTAATIADTPVMFEAILWLDTPDDPAYTQRMTALFSPPALPDGIGPHPHSRRLLQPCENMEAVCSRINAQTAMIILPAVSLDQAHQQQLCETIHQAGLRKDTPVVIVEPDDASLADVSLNGSGAATDILDRYQALRECCIPIVLPSPAVEMTLPGMVEMAMANHHRHQSLDELEFKRDSLEQRAEQDPIFQSLLRVLPVGIAVAHDAQCNRISINAAASQLFDIPLHINPSPNTLDREKYPVKLFRDGKEVPIADLPMVRAARDGKSTFGDEFQVVRGDGTKLFVVIYSIPLFDHRGVRCGSCSVYVDNTPQKKVEKALAESESRFKLAQKCAKAGSWEWNFHTGEIIWSEEQYSLHDVPQNQDITLDAWEARIHEQDREKVRMALRSRHEFQIEYRVVPLSTDAAAAAAEPRWVLASGQVILDENQKPHRLLGICMDVTEHKTAEQKLRENAARFRTMVDASPLGVFITDALGQFQYVNAQLQNITGQANEKLIKDGLWTLVHPDEKQQVLDSWQEAMAAHSRYESIFRIVLENQQISWIHLRAEPVINEEMLSGYIGKVEDITRQRHAQTALRQSQENLQRANASLAQRHEDMEEFLSITAHDLKHPVVGIQGLLSLLKEDCYDKLSEENKQNLDLSLGECDRMKEMLTRLSELGRIEQTRPRMNQTSLKNIVETCAKRYQALCAKNRIELKVDASDVQLQLPRAILEEVLSNLIDNAIKYGCDKEQGVIQVEAGCDDSQCWLRVSDNGKGVPTQHHERIFKPFRRLVTRENKQTTGSGLGLTAVKRLIQRIGGSVRITSGDHEGAKFELVFPAHHSPPD